MKLVLNKSLLITIPFYIIGNAIVYYTEYKYEIELKSFDLNNNGNFEINKRTPAYEKAMKNVIYDTSRTFAP